VQSPATETQIRELWVTVKEIDSTLVFYRKYKKGTLKEFPKVEEFISHCCQVRHYSISVKKCGKLNCNMCKPPRLPVQKFTKLSHIPDPVPGTDGHYLPFTDVYGKIDTDEQHRPSLQKSAKKNPYLLLPAFNMPIKLAFSSNVKRATCGA